MSLFKTNCCDGIYNSIDVHFTSLCDNRCAHCIDCKYQGLNIPKPNPKAIAETIIKQADKCEDVLFLGGEPCLFMRELIDCIDMIQRYTSLKVYVTTSVPKTMHDDKDLICKGNRVYAPDVCCFVPHRINSLIIGCDKARGNYPKGVSKMGNKYSAYLRRDGEAFRIGLYNTPEEAFAAYKSAKESYIKEVATSYYNEGKIAEKVYNALMNYQVEITD